LVISLPFTFGHLIARPDDAPITAIQHVTAALANFFGPWGGHRASCRFSQRRA
jgi:hypothetical protein